MLPVDKEVKSIVWYNMCYNVKGDTVERKLIKYKNIKKSTKRKLSKEDIY